MSNTTDYWKPLFDYSESGILSVVIATASSVAMVLVFLCSGEIAFYDEEINRRTTLLTKFNTTILRGFMLMTLTTLLDAVRFTTGVKIPHVACQVRAFYDQSVKELMAFTIMADAVFHYRFLQFRSRFPIVNDNLVHTVIIRSALSFILVNVLRRIVSGDPMPREYHVCAGTDPNSSKLCEKLQLSPGSYPGQHPGIFAAMRRLLLFALVLLAVMVIWKKVQLRAEEVNSTRQTFRDTLVFSFRTVKDVLTHQDQSNENRKLVVNIGNLLMKIFFVFVMSLVKRQYKKEVAVDLTRWPGSLLLLYYHFIGNPIVGVVTIISRLAWDQDLREHLRRKIVRMRQQLL